MQILFFLLSAVDLSAGVVGLTLSYSIMLTGVFQPFIEESAELENLVSFIVLGVLKDLTYWAQMFRRLKINANERLK